MAKITVGFSTDPNSWTSRLIRWFTKSKASHCFLMVDDPFLGYSMLIVESDAHGVAINTPSRFNFAVNPLLKEFNLQATHGIDLAPALKEAVNEYLGARYDYLGVVGMAWVLFWRRLKKKVMNPLHQPKELFCSTFVTRVLQLAKYPGAELLTPQNTNAQDVWDLLDGKPVQT
jgi:hypothetical protein